MAELVANSFEEFAAYLNASPQTDDVHENMRNMGKHYVEFALKHPTRYRMMFNTPLPPIAEHPNMMVKARHVFELLTKELALFPSNEVDVNNRAALESDALFAWASMHGMVSIFQSDSIAALELSDGNFEFHDSACSAKVETRVSRKRSSRNWRCRSAQLSRVGQ